MVRYGANYNSILDMEIEDGLSMITKAVNKRDDERLWLLWTNVYTSFTDENYIPFHEFKDRIMKPKQENVKKKTDAEILKDTENILKIKK